MMFKKDAHENYMDNRVGTILTEGSNLLHFRRGRRVPMMRQSELSECGLACVGMVAGYHGYHSTLSSLRQRFQPSMSGTTVAQILEWGQALGMSGRAIRLELSELNQIQRPCIIHWNFDHFIVLVRVSRKKILINDPVGGQRALSYEEFSRNFTGVALEFVKNPTFQRQRPPPPVSLRLLAGSIHGLGRALAHIFGLALVLELIALITPQFMQVVVDQVLADGDRDLLAMIGISFMALLVAQIAINALRTWSVIWIGTHFSLNWIGNVFNHLIRLPKSYFIKRGLGDIVSRFGSVGTIQQAITAQFVTAIIDGLMMVATLVMLLFYSPYLTLIVVSGSLVYIGLRLLYFRVFREANLNQIVVNARQQTGFLDSMRGVQTLQLYNKLSSQTSKYLNLSADSLNTSVAVQKLSLLFGSLSSLASGAQRVGVLWFGAWLALKQDFTAGMLMAFVSYADQFGSRSASFIDYVIQLRLLRLQGERLADIVLTPTESFSEGTYVGPLPEPSIRFENVSFRYAEGDPWIVKNCSFNIDAGESVAITGPSGCGKSTLARLMLGLLDPQAGSISVGGIDLKNLGKKIHRSRVASVMQDDHLFAGSIADNLSFFDDAASMDRIQEAAKFAMFHDDVIAMPMGYHTQVGDMGSSLSGGQQQRLFLARALYRKPAMLILDEATSHLDIARETAISKLLKSLSLTRIFVAHRPETIANADRILVMSDGAIRPLPRA